MELKKIFKLVLLSFCLLTFTFNNLIAQTNYSFTNITEGLPSLETYSVVQDDNGFIWVATDRGICRYDGKKFKVYGIDDGLNDPVVFKLVNAGGQIWFKCYNGDFGRIKNHKVEIIKNYPSSIYLLHELYGFGDKIIVSWQLRNKNICYDEFDKRGNFVLSDTTIRETCTIKPIINNRFIILGSVINENKKININDTILSNCILPKILGPHHSVISDKNGLYLTVGSQLIKLDSTKANSFDLPDNVTTGSLLDNKNNLWVCTYSGIVLFNRDNLLNNQIYLEKYEVSSITQDFEGNYWITTLSNGLYYVKPSKTKSLIEGKIEDLKSENQTLVALKNRSHFVKVFGDSISSENISGVIQSYSYNNQKIRFTFRTEPKIKRETNDISSINLHGSQVLKSNKSETWVLAGKYIYYTKNEFMRKIPIHNSNYGKMKYFQHINDSTEILSNKNGIFRLEYGDLKNASLTKLSDIYLKSILLGSKWNAGSVKGIGIVFFDKNWHPQDTLGFKSGLSSQYNSKVLPINGGDTLLIAGSKGLDIIHYKDKQIKILNRFTTRDGLLSNEINDIHILNNQLYIASSKGLQVINQNDLFEVSPISNVKLNLLSVNNQHTLNKNSIQLPAGSKTVNFNFYALAYSNPHGTMLEYRIPELEKTWKTTHLNQVEYGNMIPGNYHFEFRVKGSEATDKIKFELKASFYETKTFKASIALVILFGMLYLWYLKTQNEYKKLKNKMENERLRQSALIARLNPHFLFNTLGGLQSLILQNETKKATSYVSGFSDLMRHILKRSGERYTALYDEIQFIVAYIELENIKQNMDTIINWTFDKSIDVNDFYIPSMFLQPIIENSIKHGMIGYRKDGIIEAIFKVKSKNIVEIIITDNGKGYEIKPNPSDRTHSSDIILKRINLMQKTYNKSYKIEFENIQNQESSKTGTRVTLQLPYDKSKN